MKKAILCLMLLLLAAPTALADSWAGRVEADMTVPLTAGASGTLTALNITAGQLVTRDDALGFVGTTRCFAPVSGAVAAVHAKEGEAVSGTVLEIEPISPYVIACTLTDAVDADNAALHCGETLYMRCTADGTHRAYGRVTSIDGSDYQVEALGGELYVGETVFLYRDRDFAKSSLVGRGTVVASETIAVAVEGTVISLSVAQGDQVERGQLLLTTASSQETALSAPCGGIVTEVLAQVGDAVQEEQILAWIASGVALRFEVTDEDMARFQAGQRVAYLRGDDPHETPCQAVVKEVLVDAEGGGGTVVCLPEDALLPIGMSVTMVDAGEKE